MVRKIFFGNKPLFLNEEKPEELEAFSKGKTVVIKDLQKHHLQSIIGQMQEASTEAGLILFSATEAFNALKNEFTLIQASGGLVYDNDKILMIYRRGKWDLPKGKLDEGEDLVRCALREIKEETGLANLVFEQTLYTTYHTYYEGGKHILKESHWHLITGQSGDPLTPQIEEDIEKCEWIHKGALEPYLKNAPASIIDVIEEGLKVIEEKKSLGGKL